MMLNQDPQVFEMLRVLMAVIVGAALPVAVLGAIDYVRSAPARKLERLVRRSKGRWSR